MIDPEAIETFLRQPELTDDECGARAMLIGRWVRFTRSVRIYGKRALRDDANMTYLNPVTLEVIYMVGENNGGLTILSHKEHFNE